MSEESKVTIVLTKPALERLIGGDSELEVQLRHAAVKHIVEEHLETVIRTYAYEEVEDRLKHGLLDLIDQKIGQKSGSRFSGFKITLSEETERALTTYINSTITVKMREIVKECVAKLDLPKRIQDAIDNEVFYKIRDGVKKRIEEVREKLVGG